MDIHDLIAGGLAAALALPAAAAEFNVSLDAVPLWQDWNRASPYAVPLVTVGGRSLRTDLDLRWREGGWNAHGSLRNTAAQGLAPEQQGVLQEAYYDGDPGSGQAYTVGKKVMSWGVGFGFRPLDVVQREDRRAVAPPPLEGQPLLAWEHFGAEQAWTLAWVRPGAGGGPSDYRASSLAAHWYGLLQGQDWHGVARLSERHGLELGGGSAWTRGDEWAFHGAALYETRYRKQVNGLLDGGGLLALGDPMQEVQGGSAWRAVAGAQWTGASGWSVLGEAWYDGEAWRRADWQGLDALTLSQRALAGTVPQFAIDGNIAGSAQAYATPNLLRQNLLLRLAWEEERRWNAWVECLLTPEDGGRVLTTGVTWTGDRQSLQAGLRFLGGRSDSAYAQAPVGRLAWLEWKLGF